MKCIHCNTDNKYQERVSSGQRCKGCGHPFAFEPKTDPFQMNDPLFARAVKDVSADGTLSFTPKQLWYEINRRILVRKTLSCGAGVLLPIAGGSLIAQSRYATPLMVGIPPIALCAGVVTNRSRAARNRKKPRHPKMPFATFETGYLPKWIAAHGLIPKMLPLTVPHSRPASFGGETILQYDQNGNPMPVGQNAAPDVTAYSFDRALIVENAEIAAMLVANNFHFENNCAILSLDGYPFGNADTIKTMLGRNPQLKVFALHDATIRGTQIGLTLRLANWFPNRAIPLIDLGLRPQHVFESDMITLVGSPTQFPVGTVSSSLKGEEIDWLQAGNTAELHSLRPQRIMRAVYQGFARANQLDGASVGDDGFIIVDTGPSYWYYNGGTPGGADVYASDSFG